MAIYTRDGFNGPLGEVTHIDGEAGMEVMRLATHVAALKFYMNTGMKVTRMWSIKSVKAVTGLKTSDKAKHLAKLEQMLADAKAVATYIRQTK
jgi:hypothetical protein